MIERKMYTILMHPVILIFEQTLELASVGQKVKSEKMETNTAHVWICACLFGFQSVNGENLRKKILDANNLAILLLVSHALFVEIWDKKAESCNAFLAI